MPSQARRGEANGVLQIGVSSPRAREGIKTKEQLTSAAGYPRAVGILLSGDLAEPVLPAGPTHLGDFVPDIPVTPAQATRDLFYREATHEHVTQLVHLRI